VFVPWTKRENVSMRDEAGSIIFPDQFIPAVAKFDLMPNIDSWVIRNFNKLVRK